MFVSRWLSHPKEFGVSDFNEDAAFCSDDLRWFAVSDGVGSALFSDIWSRALCQSICRNRAIWGEPSFDSAMTEAREQWHGEIDWSSLDYFRKKKFSRQGGSFATLLYGVANESPSGDSGGVAVRLWSYGDCNMFQIRDSKPVAVWPWTKASDFGSAPPSLCSVASVNTDASLWRSHEVTLQPNDSLILATDAFAEYLVKQIEENQNFPWKSILGISAADFAMWIEKLRETNSIERDDTTFLAITYGRKSVESNPAHSDGIWWQQQLFSGWRHAGMGWEKILGRTSLIPR